MMFYTTIENQLRADGSRGLLYDHFDDIDDAKAKFYTICAAAAASKLPYHSAHILQSDGNILKQEIFDRRNTEPEAQKGGLTDGEQRDQT